jgi:hypothetical protein
MYPVAPVTSTGFSFDWAFGKFIAGWSLSEMGRELPTTCYSTLRSPVRAAVVTFESGTLDT